ncbi:hypothetical protein DYI24_01080 [Rhodopseudomonas sp. BR0C11]|uniref:hypothetical protein n=1 Tax=Rhodopseudomonas sp. BR0C11 TaxID=2269370 RepID=UPI0013DEA138|nr:hypothetical protein [Rhodopseudomonas sp. BR0C11]NEV75638.1 hypothetical protein [Rhodopseudomonas sp. BR0C11]
MGTTGLTALDVIIPLFGAGGITTIIVAVISYMQAARAGRRGEPEKAAGAIGISALLADAESVTKLSLSLDRLALAIDKIALLTAENREDLRDAIDRATKLFINFMDEFRDLRHAVEDANRNRGGSGSG